MATDYSNTSQTVATTAITVNQMIEHAYRDAGKFAEEATPEYVNAARQTLYYILMNMSNKGVNLWLLDYILIGSETNQRQMWLPKGSVDVREANYRYPIRINPSSDSSGNNILSVTDLSQSYTIPAGGSVVGVYTGSQKFLHAGFNSTNFSDSLVVEYSLDNVNWLPLITISKQIQSNNWGYQQIDQSPVTPYWRFRNPGTSAVTVRALVLGSVQQDIPLARLNRDDYFNLPNKDFNSNRALQYWFDRGLTPIMNLWPVPQDDFQLFQILVERQLNDVGTLTNQIAIPDRWLPAVQAEFSFKFAMQLPGVDLNRVGFLKSESVELYNNAADEERDKSPIYFAPNISHYTR